MKNCDTCKWWGGEPRCESDGKGGWSRLGECLFVTKNDPANNSNAWIENTWRSAPSLMTRAHFGCNQHEPKEEGA